MSSRTAVPGDRVHPGGEYHALPDPVTDRIFSVLMALAAEVWTVRDRLRIAEAALAGAGIDVEAHFQEHRDDEAALAAIAADRDEFTARVLRAVSPAPMA